jgi:hypothetical protein
VLALELLDTPRLLGLGGRRAGLDRHVVQFLPVGVDLRTVGAVADVVPHGRAELTRRGCVDVVAEELGRQVVLARVPRVPGRPAMLLGERTHRAVGRHVRVQDYADELPVVIGTLGALPERRGERVVDDPHVRAVRRDRGSRVVAAVALLGDVGQIGPRVTAVRRGAEQDALVVQRLLLCGGEHDLIRRVLAARCAVGDVDGRVRHEVVAGTPKPSMTHRPIESSTYSQPSFTVNRSTGRCQVAPPLTDRIIWIVPSADPVALNAN